MKNRQASRGFTIVELLVVTVVIAVLAAIIVISYNGIQDRARSSRASQDMATIQRLILLYNSANGNYPNSSLCNNVDTNYQFGWCGFNQGTGNSFIPGIVPTYASTIPNLDPTLPFNNTYLYRSSGSTDGTTSGTTYYELIRYNPAGLTNAEKNGNTLLLTDNGYDGIAWGYKSDPGLPTW